MPTSAEIAYGVQHGWLSRQDAIAVALAKYEAGTELNSAEEELALLLSDDVDHLGDLIADLAVSDEPPERRARLWLFLALASLREHRSQYADPLGVIEMLYADFDYPDEIRGLVRYMPARPGETASIEGVERRWQEYVDRVGTEYRHRD